MGDESMILPAKAKAYLEEHLVTNKCCVFIFLYTHVNYRLESWNNGYNKVLLES